MFLGGMTKNPVKNQWFQSSPGQSTEPQSQELQPGRPRMKSMVQDLGHLGTVDMKHISG